MKLSPAQIEAGLQKRLFPVCLVCGDEPLQHGEALDAIRAACKKSGYVEREIFDVEAGFNWERFEVAARNTGLFADKRLIELRFGAGLPDKKAETRLLNYLKCLPAETVLVLSCGKLAKSASGSAWFRAVDRAGVVVQVWPLQRDKFPGWLESRVKATGLVMDKAALRLLASRVEGNLLAAAQEIDKLYVLYGASPLDADRVREAVANSAHYDVFDLADSVLAGKVARSARILQGLRAEGTAAQIVLWALSRDLRTLAGVGFGLERGAASTVYRDQRIAERRRALFDAALRRLGLARVQKLIARCATIDRVGKGLANGDVWDELLSLSLSIAADDPLNPTHIPDPGRDSACRFGTSI